MENRTFYNEILTDHNLHPLHKEKLPDANLVLEGVNPSCGDDIILQLKVEDGQVVDGAFEGSGCAISQASADIMLDLIIGKSEEEARHLADLFLRMIKGEAGENEIEELEIREKIKRNGSYSFGSVRAGRTISALMIYIAEIVWKRKKSQRCWRKYIQK